MTLFREGHYVLEVQRNLVALGEQIKVTGTFDRPTFDAVQRFQARHGLQVDGKVDLRVFKLLEAEASRSRLARQDGDVKFQGQEGRGVWTGFSTVKRPGVQVVMTARNASACVERAIISLELALRNCRWMLVFVDDGSSDPTYALAADRVTTASRRIFKRTAPSASIGDARNYALKLGEEHRKDYPLIYFFDADDEAMPWLVESLFDPLMLSGAPAAYGNYQLVSHNFPEQTGPVIAKPEHQLEGNIPIGTVAFHMSLIPADGNLFTPGLQAHEDGDLWLRWFKSGVKMLAVNSKPVCLCRKEPGSVSVPYRSDDRQKLEADWVERRIQIMEGSRKPLVSALMVTGKCPERAPLARVAVRCFLDQTWPNKQLIIVNHGNYTLSNGDPRIKEIKAEKKAGVTLGDLRNMTIDLAEGEWLVQWDDDDWHHPKRIEVQMEYARKPDELVTFLWQIRLNLVDGSAFYDKMDDGQHMSILFHRSVPYRYLSLEIREDTEFKKNFARTEAIDNNLFNPKCDPLMYVRTYHGYNIWDASHIMHGSMCDYRPKPNFLDLVGYHVDRVRRIIDEYRSEPGFNLIKPG